MLKTICEFCIFVQPEHRCFLQKQTFLENGKQHTEGFCRHKRSIKWLNSKNLTNTRDVINTIESEEQAVTAIVTCVDNNYDDVIHTISMIEHPIIKEIIIVLYMDKNPTELIDRLQDVKTKWQLTNMLGEEVPDDLIAADHASAMVSHNWFLPVKAGNGLSKDELEFISGILKVNANIVGAYIDIDDPSQMLINKFAFMEMEGNYIEPWFNKIKKMDNWENSCIKIQRK